MGFTSEKPHAVLVPFPAQGHVNPMLMLGKFLHSKGFHITFVNTEFNQRRLVRSRGLPSINSVPDFQFETISDGLPESDLDSTQDIASLCESTTKTCGAPFRNLINKLNHQPSPTAPPVSCIVSDGIMSFTLDVASEFGIPDVLFWTISACGFMAYLNYRHLLARDLIPLKDVDDLDNGYLDTSIDSIPGMKNMRLKDFPTFLRTTDHDDFMLNFVFQETERASRASAIILNTFDDLERPALESMASILPPIYTIGPLSFQVSHQIPSNSPLNSLGSSLWTEEHSCLQWLDRKGPNSVVYVNFGSITTMTNKQLVEFAWGLANSNRDFLWVVRPDIVKGDTAVLPPEFETEIKERGLLCSWCPQEAVLLHPSVGGFLTHNGWNSTLESICGGVPMICWPFFAEQQTNTRYVCTEWGIGMEIDSNVRRKEVEEMIKELMEGDKGKEMRMRAMEWKERAIKATSKPRGSSFENLDRIILDVLLPKKNI